MPYLILGIAVLIGIYFLVRGLRGTNPQNLQKTLVVVVIVISTAMILFLTLTGRLGPIGWLLMVVPALFRWRAILQGMKNMRGPTPGKNSDIETAYLRMTLEHDSGVLRGTVLQGRQSGRNLDEMSLDELLDLLRECRVEDPQSVPVLESYLDRVHSAEWRGFADAAAGTDGGGAGMTTDQAYEILGLKSGATDDEIREAHRALLKANHPDRGGSTWLAAQINLAKDLLLPDG
jgi:hypothetical protein